MVGKVFERNFPLKLQSREYRAEQTSMYTFKDLHLHHYQGRLHHNALPVMSIKARKCAVDFNSISVRHFDGNLMESRHTSSRINYTFISRHG